jgi:aryl-alcohol dehydrogenase-like predicted oxidoreductase
MDFVTWALGNRLSWNYGRGDDQTDIKEAFDAAISAGRSLFSSAEVYVQGRSERFIGEFISSFEDKPRTATKFFPHHRSSYWTMRAIDYPEKRTRIACALASLFHKLVPSCVPVLMVSPR